MKHYASPAFWEAYNKLPPRVRELADKNYRTLEQDPRHPSSHFKKVGSLWSVRIGIHHRALGAQVEAGAVWFWIGSHSDYDALTR